MINRTALLDGLQELSSAKVQRELWIEGDTNRMSSFTEAISYTFDDSGVARAIDRGDLENETSKEIANQLQFLRTLIRSVPQRVTPAEIMRSPNMPKIRSVAREILMLLSKGTE